MSQSRNGEHVAWKLLRLWPVAVAIISISGMIYITSDNVGDLQAANSTQWTKINKNKDAISELEKQTGIMNYRLQDMNDTLSEQKSDIKEILRAVK